MLRTIIQLSDGSQVSSGGINAVQSITITHRVNEEDELTVGSCCASMVEVKLLTPGGGLRIGAGEQIQVYRVDEEGQRHKVGVFTTQKPTRPSANTMAVTAYDRVTWLDKDLSQWLAGLEGWPFGLLEFGKMVCRACGVELINEDIPNADLPVERFAAGQVTGRQLMRWVGQVCGRFCRATADGALEFAWYSPRQDVSIGPAWIPGSEITVLDQGQALTICGENVVCAAAERSLEITSPQLRTAEEKGELNILIDPYQAQYFYYQDGLSFADYTVTGAEQVLLRQSANDVGTCYPGDLQGANTYCITGNPIVAALEAGPALAVAEGLYQQLRQTVYTPCKVEMPANRVIAPGDMLNITDKNGRQISMLVMTKIQRGQRDILECTGSFRRDDTGAVNNRSYSDLQGKVLELKMDMDGLRLENKDADKQAASVKLAVDGIQSRVQSQSKQMDSLRTEMTSLRQDAQAVQLEIQNIQQQGVSRVQTTTGYTFGAEGLRIRKSGEEMENLLDNTGMYVTRAGEAILQANHSGVVARDVTIHNYLTVGDHARLENYGQGRTGCFYI